MDSCQKFLIHKEQGAGRDFPYRHSQGVVVNFYALGRYIFREDFLNYLKEVKPDKTGEIQLSDAISMYLNDKKDLIATKLCGKVFDCGNQLGYFRAILNFASKDKRLKKEISNFSKIWKYQ